MPGVIFALNFLVLRHRVGPAGLIGFAMTVIGVAVTVSNGSLARLLALVLGGIALAERWPSAERDN